MTEIKKIAIFLPAFHQIEENDRAWGEGFTEWNNVRRGVSLFDGHNQPHEPSESVGYYDLSEPDVLSKQAELARINGIHGFAFYHYWFNGKRVFKKPIDQLLQSGSPDFPFCFIWANENWSKRWNGSDEDVIISHQYSAEDDLLHIAYLCEEVFSDSRYIKINGKPVFLVYRTELFPDIKQTVALWRSEAVKRGFPGIYLIRVDNFDKDVIPSSIDFDAALEFAPDWTCTGSVLKNVEKKNLYSYVTTVLNMIDKKKDFRYFNCVFPGWDNSPRRIGLGGSIFIDNHPDTFKRFLEAQMMSTMMRFSDSEERLIFINAWNEWGEGCFIEPGKLYGTKYLEICKNAEPCALSEYERHTFSLIKKMSEELAVINMEKQKVIEKKQRRIKQLRGIINRFKRLIKL